MPATPSCGYGCDSLCTNKSSISRCPSVLLPQRRRLAGSELMRFAADFGLIDRVNNVLADLAPAFALSVALLGDALVLGLVTCLAFVMQDGTGAVWVFDLKVAHVSSFRARAVLLPKGAAVKQHGVALCIVVYRG